VKVCDGGTKWPAPARAREVLINGMWDGGKGDVTPSLAARFVPPITPNSTVTLLEGNGAPPYCLAIC
jgi:hypothetical protein